MKKKQETYDPLWERSKLQIRKMKLTIILSLLVLISFGNGFSQTKLSLKFEKATIQEVIQIIESKTDFVFLYKDDLFDKEQRYSADFEETNFSEVLATICETAKLDYEVRNERQIILMQKDLSQKSQQPNIHIAGSVTGTDGLPIPGVSILAKGTTIGTISDIDGKFMLEIPATTEFLSISFIGMKTQEIPVDGKTQFTVVMEEDFTEY